MEPIPGRLLVVAHQAEWPGIDDALKIVAAPNCLNRCLVHVWLVNDVGVMVDVSTSLPVTWNDVPKGLQILATKAVRHLPKDKLSQTYGCPVLVKSSSHYFKPDREGFFQLLDHSGISWLSHAREEYATYDYGSSSFGVNDWLDQFRRIGAYDLGEQILRETRVKLTRDCVSHFRSKWNGQPLAPDSRIGVLSRIGKSGAALSPGLQKSFNSQCHEITDCIEKSAEEDSPRLIHIFEDGLWTGIELKRVIDSLRGVAVKPKCAALKRINDLQKNEIEFHFSVVTDLGYMAALDLFKREGLSNFKINVVGAERLEVLTEVGKAQFSEGIVGFGDVESFSMDPELVLPHFLTTVRSRPGFLPASGSLETASRVGFQLWRQRNPGIKIDADKCIHLGFGSNGIGASLIFQHSVAQAVLPLLWCNGTIEWGQHKFAWRGLYPERPYE